MSEHLRFLFLGLTILCAIGRVAYETNYQPVGVAKQANVLSNRPSVLGVDPVPDRVALDDLLPQNEPSFRIDDVSNRLSPSAWAAVESAAKHAVETSPLNSKMWLILGIAEAVKRPAEGHAVAAALKMSYFTAPKDITITEPRLALSVWFVSTDPDLYAAVRRDIRSLSMGPESLRTVLDKTYCHALPDARAVIVKLASEIDSRSAGAWHRGC
jgi:hypothetical protein